MEVYVWDKYTAELVVYAEDDKGVGLPNVKRFFRAGSAEEFAAARVKKIRGGFSDAEADFVLQEYRKQSAGVVERLGRVQRLNRVRGASDLEFLAQNDLIQNYSFQNGMGSTMPSRWVWYAELTTKGALLLAELRAILRGTA